MYRKHRRKPALHYNVHKSEVLQMLQIRTKQMKLFGYMSVNFAKRLNVWGHVVQDETDSELDHVVEMDISYLFRDSSLSISIHTHTFLDTLSHEVYIFIATWHEADVEGLTSYKSRVNFMNWVIAPDMFRCSDLSDRQLSLAMTKFVSQLCSSAQYRIWRYDGPRPKTCPACSSASFFKIK